MLTAIAAVDINFGIGKNGDLLFHIPDDMKFFRRTTLGHTVIMGRKTLESLPNSKPFKDRKNIILTRDTKFKVENAVTTNNISEIAKLSENSEEIFVVGGGEIYKQLLPYCQKALITKISSNAGAEIFFPNLDKSEDWKLTQASDEYEYEGLKYRFCTYEKI